MTTEVIVMNKTAIALAADSAVTIGYQAGDKIYNSANKLFVLGHHCPVGLMIYSSADLMELPWEIIIHRYRTQLGYRTFPTLTEYASDFLRFLEVEANTLFPPDHQERHLSYRFMNALFAIVADIRQRQTDALKMSSTVDTDQIASGVTNEHYNRWKEMPLISSIPMERAKVLEQEIVSTYGTSLMQIAQMFFATVQAKMSRRISNQLKKIAGWILTKDNFETYSGLVFAGFGDNDLFPSFSSYKVGFFVNDYLKYSKEDEDEIAYDSPVIVKSFAQSDMVEAFINGINPEYITALKSYLSRLLQSYPKTVIDQIPNLSEDAKEDLLEKLIIASRDMMQDFEQKMLIEQPLEHARPLISNVSNLPIDELAAMAESLVSITSLKRRFSAEAETVGGPIDVAVISKKDGFIWIKRKHYFSPELNQHYIAAISRNAEGNSHD